MRNQKDQKTVSACSSVEPWLGFPVEAFLPFDLGLPNMINPRFQKQCIRDFPFRHCA
jgi:hypothetical protein